MVKCVVRTLGVGIFAMALVAGCSQKGERLNAPPQGTTERPSPLQKHFEPMVDNAAKFDRNIADVHFEPESTALSGLGVWRINRVARVLTPTGGTIRYETALRDDDMIAARLQAVRDYLAASGYDTDRIKVEAGLSKNTPGNAATAMQARAKWEQSSATSSDGANAAGAPMGPRQ